MSQVQIIERSEWGARAPRNRDYVSWDARTEFIVHHSAGPTTQTVRSIQDFHLDGRGWSDIGYNLLVDDAGNAYEGRGWQLAGAHAVGHNTSGVGVCYIGQNSPTAAAKVAIRALYDEATRRAGRTLEPKGHRDVNETDCPGGDLHTWVHNGMPADGLNGGRNAMSFINLGLDDTGPIVGELQIILKEIGREHPEVAEALGTWGPREDGVDEEYGPSTAEAVRRARALDGSRAAEGWGDRMSKFACVQVDRVVGRVRFKKNLERFGVGTGGGDLPDTVSVSGELNLED